YEATNGTRGKLRFDAASANSVADSAGSGDWSDDAPNAEPEASSSEVPDDYWADGEDWTDAKPEPAKPQTTDLEEVAQAGSGGANTTVFWVGVATTGILAGVSTWSGIDTLQHPGTDTVVARCVGLGESCPEYQEGL